MSDDVTIKLISHFFAKLGVDAVGPGIVTKLVNSGYKTIPAIIDAFKNNKDALEDIEGMGQKIVNKIWNNIETTLGDTNLETLMAASHLFGRGFGERKIREIINKYPNIMKEKWNKKTMTENVSGIKGFSFTTATQFANNFSKFIKLFNEINDIIDISYLEDIKSESDESLSDELSSDDDKYKNQDLKDLSFICTGFRDKALEKQITDRGGHISTSVSGKTTAVIKADDAGPSGKTNEAEKKGIQY